MEKGTKSNVIGNQIEVTVKTVLTRFHPINIIYHLVFFS